MNTYAQKYLDDHGREEVERICVAAETSLVYYLQCCEGKRNFSRKLAERLEIASDGRMSKVGLVFGEIPEPAAPSTSDQLGAGHAG